MKKIILLAFVLMFSTGVFSQYYYNLYDEAKQNPGGLNTDNEYPVGGGLSTGWTVASGITGDVTTPRWSDKIRMPFIFEFNGTEYDTIRAATSGVVTFTTNPATIQAFGNVALPQANVPDNSVCILGLTTNWNQGSQYARVVTKTFGTAPNRQFWVTYNSFGATTTQSTAFMTFSIVFEETSNKIYIVDQRVGNGSGLKLSMGIQINESTAISVTGSPNVANIAGINPLPDDNAYYEFIYGAKPAYDVAVLTINMEKYYALSQTPIDVKGRLVNFGSETITSMDINYSIDGGTAVTSNLTGLSIAPGAKYNFTHPQKFNPTTEGNYNIVAWASNINGNADEIPENDEANYTIIVVEQMIQRQVLLEAFSSSTCPPCKPGNEKLHSVVGDDIGKFTLIKYQVDFPGTGDPYATTETVNRRGYYGINSVPRLEIDGGWDANPNNLTQTIFDNAYVVPSFLEITAKHTLNWRTVSTEVTINPLTNFTNPNLRLFIVIFEKITYNNLKTNGETEFHHIVKKMVPSETGIVIGNLTKGTEFKTTRAFEFKGDYRLPTNGQAANRINHNIEHSVENFANLSVAVFVQDYSTKEVFQSAYSTGTIGSIGPEYEGNGIVSMYPNPASDFVYIDFRMLEQDNVQLNVYNALGQLAVSENMSMQGGNHTFKLNTNHLDEGIYILHLTIGDQVFSRKFIVQ